MPALEDAIIYGIQIRESANDGSDFGNADADYRIVFLGEDGLWHAKDSAGTVTNPFSGGGGVATDTIWNAAGDLAVGTGSDTAARLGIGSNGTVLTSNGTTAAWVSPTDPRGFTTIVTTADQDVTNNTNQDHAELQFAVTATKHYMTEWHLMVSGSDTAGDFAFRFAVAAGTLDGRSSLTHNDGTLAAAVASLAASAAANTGSTTIGTPADITYPTAVRLVYDFEASNTTTFKLQFGNAAASSGRISRVFKGSYVQYKQTD